MFSAVFYPILPWICTPTLLILRGSAMGNMQCIASAKALSPLVLKKMLFAPALLQEFTHFKSCIFNATLV